ncbi:MAG: homocysteine S-methyltransferase family protein, partial [Gammaproteobacteria bacterium]|nr:homocysteine S-methyltransferase family protein [Gammaproteobacteria bacterium]
VLERVYRSYIDTALTAAMPVVVGTATWRANEERVRASVFSDRTVNQDNVRFLQAIRDSYADAEISILIEGDIGPRGDAYQPREALDIDTARSFHAWQIEALASSQVDFLQASTLPALSEATGIALAMAETGLPYAVSFVVEKSGCLLDGTRLLDAIARIDDAVGDNSARYSINCVHPTILLQALDNNPGIADRIISFCGNTSDLSTAELDGMEELQTQAPEKFALANKQLLQAHDIRIIGGCCGSGPEHIREIAAILE